MAVTKYNLQKQKKKKFKGNIKKEIKKKTHSKEIALSVRFIT